MTKETYWAVRIGTPGKNNPYFMLQEGCTTPQLFNCKPDAVEATIGLPDGGTVVKVEVREKSKPRRKK